MFFEWIYHYSFLVFDVSNYGADNEKVNGPFTLTMKYDQDQYHADEVDIYYYDEEQGIWIKQNGTVNVEDGTITIVVDHFSKYGVFSTSTSLTSEDAEKDADEKAKVDEETKSEHCNVLPKTATSTFNIIVIGLILIVFGGATFFFMRRKSS